MKKIAKVVLTSVSLGIIALSSGCAVVREQQTVGTYIDDATITTQIKSRMAADPVTNAIAISVETLKGEVQLSGFAKNASEKSRAEVIARDVNGVKRVRNDIVVRP
ncbi:MAG: BON domain-containing protein [Betaproteobacteria bacterium]|nr:MAG: BON domain-containing protein [Betaproteobacteria bacterium]